MSENLKYSKMLALHFSKKEIRSEQKLKYNQGSINIKDYIFLPKTIRERDNNNNRKINDHSIRREVSIFATLIFEQYTEGDWYSLTFL